MAQRHIHPAQAAAAALDAQPVPTPGQQPATAPQTPNLQLVTPATPAAPAATAAQVPTPSPAAATPTPAPATPDPTAAWQRERDQLRLQALQAQQQHQQATQQYSDLEQRFNQMQADLERANQEREQLLAQSRQTNVDNLLNVDITGLQHLDPEVATEIRDQLLRPVTNQLVDHYTGQLTQRDQEIQRLREEQAARERQQQEQATLERNTRTNAAIRSAHPDLDDILRDERYVQFVQQPIPGTLTTYGSQLEQAYASGDAEYISTVLKQFKGQQPDLESVATPQINNVATTPATPNEPQFSYEDPSVWRMQRARKEITHEEYAEKMAAFREAEANGLVQ